MTSISGVAFSEAWPARVATRFGEVDAPTIGRSQLIANKRATGRPRDLLDIEDLERASGR